MLTNKFEVIRVRSYGVRSIAEALVDGHYYDESNPEITEKFADEPIGLDEDVDVHLFLSRQLLCRGSEMNEALRAQNIEPLQLRHLFGIGIQCPEKQKHYRLLATGSVRDGLMLSAGGHHVVQFDEVFQALDLIRFEKLHDHVGCLFGGVVRVS